MTAFNAHPKQPCIVGIDQFKSSLKKPSKFSEKQFLKHVILFHITLFLEVRLRSLQGVKPL